MNGWGRLSRLVVVFLVVVLTIPIITISARQLERSDAVNITDSEKRDQYPSIAVDTNGDFHLVYTEYEDDVYDVRYQKLSPTGETLIGPLTISPNDIGYPGGCEIRVDASDRVHVVFAVNTSSSEIRDIFYAQLSWDGSVVVAADRVHTSSVMSDGPRLDTDNDGNVYIVWREAEQSPKIYWMVLGVSGTVLRPGAPISGRLGTLGDVAEPSICIGPSNDSNVVWAQKDNALLTWAVYYTRLDPSGTVEIEPRSVLYEQFKDYWGVEMAIDSSNTLHLAMMFIDPDSSFSVRYARLTTGGTVTVEREMDDPADGEAWHPSIVVGPYDDIYISYQREDDDWLADWNIYLSIFWKEEGKWQDAVKLTTNDRSQYGVVAVSDNVTGIVYDLDGDLYFLAVTEVGPNHPPTARLDAPSSRIRVGEEVVLNASLSFDQDGDISGYRYDFGDGNATGWVDEPAMTHIYRSPGCFTVTLAVLDDDGLESVGMASIEVTVLSLNQVPTAAITSIIPNPSWHYEEVTFVGTGEDLDGSIVKYRWESDIDGFIGSASSFNTGGLMPGVHNITFRVRDDAGDWSPNDSATMTIMPNRPFTIEDRTELKKEIYTDDLVEFRVIYRDLDNDFPTTMNLVYSRGEDSKTEILREVDVTDVNFVDGKEYFFVHKFEEAGKWSYVFKFRSVMHPTNTTEMVEFTVKETNPFPSWEALPTILALMIIFLFQGTRRREQNSHHP